MKHTLLASALLCAVSFAHASDLTTNSSAVTNSTAGATNAGNAQNITFNSAPASGGSSTSETVRTTPPVYAPALAASFSQANCMMSVSGGVSFIGFGAAGGAPVDGIRCDWRLDQQSTEAAAMTMQQFAHTDGIPAVTRSALIVKAARMLDAASDMSCLSSDRQRAVLETQGLCSNVADIATLDHRFNQPRNYQVDYSGK